MKLIKISNTFYYYGIIVRILEFGVIGNSWKKFDELWIESLLYTNRNKK